MNFQSNDVLLLTGAGFSHNFGLPLARDMWTWIFNDQGLQKQPRLRELMLEDFGFESVALKVRTGDFSEAEKSVMENSLQAAYAALDDILISWSGSANSASPLDIYKFQEFLTRFAGDQVRRDKKGFLFTLNQDLLIERRYYNFSAPGKVANRPQVLGLSHKRGWFSSNFRQPLTDADYCTLPESEILNVQIKDQLRQGSFFYVKLHGSHNWRSGDGQSRMVIGGGKQSQIDNDPFLSKYLKIFEEAVCQPDRRLLICGYGFRDVHINDVINLGPASSSRKPPEVRGKKLSPERGRLKAYRRTKEMKSLETKRTVT